MNIDLFAQLAMYIGGFGISDLLVKNLHLTNEKKLMFYVSLFCLSYALFHIKL